MKRRQVPRIPPDTAPTPLPYIGVTVGYEHVWKKKPSWADVEARLAQYSLPQILSAITKISTVLGREQPSWRPEAQKQLAVNLFRRDAARVLQASQEMANAVRGKGGSGLVVLFYETQLLLLLKVALLTRPLRSEEREGPLAPLGEALLMVTDLAGNSNIGPFDPQDPESEMRWLSYFIANSLSTKSDDRGHGLARSFDLYLTDKPQLRRHACYTDLPALVRRVTGLDPNALWTALFAITGHFQGLDDKALVESSAGLDRVAYFTRNFTFRADEASTFFDAATIDLANLQAEARRLYKLEDLQPYHIVPFARHPFVSVDNLVFCPSLNLAFARLMHGLHHFFLDTQKTTSQERDRYFKYMGAVFEDYVRRAIERMYPASAYLWFGEEGSSRFPGKGCDAVIRYGDALILLEVKASLLPLAAQIGADNVALKKRLDEIIIDGAEQLSATVDFIENDGLAAEGIRGRKIRHYYPIVIARERMPMNRLLHVSMTRELRARKLLLQPKVRTWQTLVTSELEEIEVAKANGRGFVDLIREKIESGFGADISFHDYCYTAGEPSVEGRHGYLGDLFHKLGEDAMNLMRSRQLPAATPTVGSS